MSRMTVAGRCPLRETISFCTTLLSQRHLTTEGSVSPLFARPSEDHGKRIQSGGKGSSNLVVMAATTNSAASESSPVSVSITAGRGFLFCPHGSVIATSIICPWLSRYTLDAPLCSALSVNYSSYHVCGAGKRSAIRRRSAFCGVILVSSALAAISSS
jgi:hypothetical protein